MSAQPDNVVPFDSTGFPNPQVCAIVADAYAEAETVVEAELAGTVSYPATETVRKLSPRRLLRRKITLAIDFLDAQRSLIDLYEAPRCRHGVSRRQSLGCSECEA